MGDHAGRLDAACFAGSTRFHPLPSPSFKTPSLLTHLAEGKETMTIDVVAHMRLHIGSMVRNR